MIQSYLLAALMTLAVGIALGYALIPLLRKMKFGQSIREEGPKAHLAKSGTPTMGGLIFMTAVTGIVLLRGEFGPEVRLFMLLFLGLGAVGFADDYLKISRKKNLGLRAWQKLVGQFAAALAGAWYAGAAFGTEILIPGITQSFDLGPVYFPFVVFVILALSNGINLTDGLDGLAGSVTVLVAVTIGIISYRTGAHSNGLLACILAGGLLAFLFFNRYPAKVFMGDVGSLALGGAVTALSLSTGTVLWILIFGIIYVIETLSVILQVGSFKLTKKRLFKMAPIHHHFELTGWHETKVVWIFNAVTALGCVISLWLLRL
ncbi:phospho-N-acetylmuramoyl-pentapeptide-transferase [Acidaminobacter hydrogenoformans]|uniref:Phospho-N-acetylmuramoyl-pentapeptide-transferase n=1 Tax=Acidaminobacter hydrogenoformans DSM 2784 TaxID=1120920 RepID=A0A1G5RT59_9FIRM|nr:phospho-N-acetylmuramoyl-pentapeptide-transferase [Acidaminobacter hydrogenoformans]SCZ77028.1 Phospho-N-acetylmuramoyl-pentapeptide-transferase [Acidaminobacter hydrogenoformans DSM 2784]